MKFQLHLKLSDITTEMYQYHRDLLHLVPLSQRQRSPDSTQSSQVQPQITTNATEIWLTSDVSLSSNVVLIQLEILR
jgi:hypothetical protein